MVIAMLAFIITPSMNELVVMVPLPWIYGRRTRAALCGTSILNTAYDNVKHP